MNRQDQNRTVREVYEARETFDILIPLILAVLSRASGDSNLRRHGKDGKSTEVGTPPPYYADQTGETAVRGDIYYDRVEHNVRAVADHIRKALNISRGILDDRTKTRCDACRRLVTERVRNGYCTRCYASWQRMGFPEDREDFEQKRRKRLAEEDVVGDTVDTVDYESNFLVDTIDDLQLSGALPLQDQSGVVDSLDK